jgi:hypothetical protein
MTGPRAASSHNTRQPEHDPAIEGDREAGA